MYLHPFIQIQHRRFVTSLLLFPVLFSTAEAQQANPRYLGITAENDIYAPRGQDRHYSNGLRIAYGPGLNDGDTSWYSRLGQVLTDSNDQKPDLHYEFAFGQNIYTPEYAFNGAPLSPDRPYAGWMYGELSVTSHKPGTADHLAVNIGIVGPAAMGRQAQKLIHELVNDPELTGWENQLRNEPGLLVRYRRRWFIPLSRSDTLQIDAVPGFGINLGNVFTDAAAGLSVRAGNYLPEADVLSRIQPDLSAAGGYYPIRNDQFDWMIYSAIQGRAIAQNIFLDGNTFTKSASVEKRTFTHDLATGFVLGFGKLDIPVLLSFSLVFRSKEFESQRGTDSFGSATISTQY